MSDFVLSSMQKNPMRCLGVGKNPKRVTPRFATSIENLSGEVVHLADPRATRAMVALMDMEAQLGGAASHYGGPAAFAELISALHGYIFFKARYFNRDWSDLFHLVNDAGHCENGFYALKANYEWCGLELSDLKGFRSLGSALTGHGEALVFPSGVLLSNGPLGSAFVQSQGLAMGEAMMFQEKKRDLMRTTVVAISDGACMEGEAREAMAAIPGFAKKNQLGPYVLIISDNNTKLTGRIDEDAFSLEPTFQSLSHLGWRVLSLPKAHDLSQCYQALETGMRWVEENPTQPVAIHAKTIKGIGTRNTEASPSGSHGFSLKSPSELHEFISEIYGGDAYPQEWAQWIQDLERGVEEKNRKSAQSQKIQVKRAPLDFPVPTKSEKIQAGVSRAMIRARREGLPVVSISSDLGTSTGVGGFRKEFPQSSVDVGVAESNMISVASGFSRLGYLPVVDTFAQFGVTKGALPLLMSALSQAPMVGVFSHTGFQDAADGASHQALTYLSMTSSLPQVDVYSLTCSEEAEALIYQTLQRIHQSFRSVSSSASEGGVQKTISSDDLPLNSSTGLRSALFFLGRENFPYTYKENYNYQLGKHQLVWNGDHGGSQPSVVLVGCGSLLGEALRAASILEDQGIRSFVVNPGIQNEVDWVFFSPLLEQARGRVVTLEDHQVIGGFGQMFSHRILERLSFLEEEGGSPTFSLKMKSLGIRGQLGRSAYSAHELYKKFGLTGESMAETARTLVMGKGKK